MPPDMGFSSSPGQSSKSASGDSLEQKLDTLALEDHRPAEPSSSAVEDFEELSTEAQLRRYSDAVVQFTKAQLSQWRKEAGVGVKESEAKEQLHEQMEAVKSNNHRKELQK